MESPDIQDNIIDHSEQLLLKKYCRETALTACSPRISLQEHGVPPRHRWGRGRFGHLPAGLQPCPEPWELDPGR